MNPRYLNSQMLFLIIILAGFSLAMAGCGSAILLEVDENGDVVSYDNQYELREMVQTPERDIYYVLSPKKGTSTTGNYYKKFQVYIFEDGKLRQTKLGKEVEVANGHVTKDGGAMMVSDGGSL